MTGAISTNRHDDIVNVQIDRAPVNALPPQDWSELCDAIGAANDDVSIRAVIVSGGEGRFCAGADIRTLTETTDEPALMLRLVAEVCDVIRSCRVPVLAAIDGPAHGGGLELALACDIRIASPGATFAASGVNMGLVASVASLTQAVGHARAGSMLITGSSIDAPTAQTWGLITEIVPTPITRARSLSQAIRDKSPLAVEATKRALAAVDSLDRTAHADFMTQLFTELAGTQDHQEAISAFLEKRAPIFTRR